MIGRLYPPRCNPATSAPVRRPAPRKTVAFIRVRPLLSVSGPSTINHKCSSGHERGIIRREKQHGFGNLIGAADATHRPVVAVLQIFVPGESAHLSVGGQHGSFNIAGTDAVHPYALTSMIN